MKHNNKLLNSIFTLLCVFSLFCVLSISAFATEQKTVRVGVFSLGQFQGFDDSGTPFGYNIDYITRIAEETHWKIQYISLENWADGIEKLSSDDIDLLSPAQVYEPYIGKFDYSAYSMGTEYGAVYAKSGTDILFEDFNSISKLRLGGVKGSTFVNYFRSYMEKAGCNADEISINDSYENTSELFSAFDRGEIDAMITNIMFYSDNLKLLGFFQPKPVYYLTHGNSELLSQLDDAMVSIKVKDPSFEASLMSKYFPIYDNNSFTFEEKSFVDSLPSVKVGYEVNHEPMSYTDKKSGEFAGITRDILDRISNISGIKFEYVPLPSDKLSLDYLKQNNIFVISNMSGNSVNTSHSSFTFSNYYLESDKVLIAGKTYSIDKDSAKIIARVTGSNTLLPKDDLEGNDIKYTEYPTVDKALKAVIGGKADALLINRYVADRAMGNPAYSSLQVIFTSSMEDNKSLTIIDDDNSDSEAFVHNKLFLSVIDKSISMIPKDELDSIILKHTANYHYKYSFSDLFKLYWSEITIISLLILLCLLLLIRARNAEASKKRELEKSNARLSDAVNQAEQANRAKSQFLSRMSHEIRTPMNAIVGLTTLAKTHDSEKEKIDEYLDKIDSSSHVLLSIINDVLDMSAIESQKLKIADTEFDIKQILDSVTNIYYTQCKHKGISYEMLTDLPNEMIVGDSLRVNQILMNLISNAYKFTSEGGKINITVKETDRKDSKIYIRFIVSDTGIGMSEEMKGRLFKPFEQENAATAQKHGGSGLGLSITKNLVDMMHGAIRVDSKQGVGTTFTVDLPFGITKRISAIDPQKLSEMRVLIVDDDINARQYTSVVLDRIGVKHDSAQDAQTAVAMLNSISTSGSRYDVCFIDWKMPGMNGVELTKLIRSKFDPKTVVIMVSAYDLSEVQDEAKAAGADMFITKPLFQSTVFNAMMQITGGIVKNTAEEPSQFDFTGHRVLLAEDNELNTEVATDILAIVNMEVDHAENGKAALEMFEKSAPGTYDLILMDIQMPEMDGYEATLAIRGCSHPEAKTIKIYAMSANAFTEDVSKALSSGMNGHLSKPIDTQKLYSTLYKAING